MNRIAKWMLAVGVVTLLGIGLSPALAGAPGHYDKRYWRGREYYRPVVFVAKVVNARGTRYIGRSSSPKIAVRKAMRSCHYDSFRPGSCRVVRVNKVRRQSGRVWY
jgi:hypothetical protein